MRKVAVVVGVGVLALAGCSSGSSSPGGSMTVTTAPVTPAMTMTAGLYVETAASAALLAIAAADLAEQRSSDPQLRALAARQKDNAEGISGQLSYAGRRVDALPSNTLIREHQAMLDQLQNAADFDAAYVRMQQQLVPQVRAFHEDYAVRGGSATLRPVAEFSAEKLAEQEAVVEAID
ncbi:DUF4142 domain-containing protein [Sphingomicrobium sediminis]|uniref:DUF4142 domain-containing protein n=1 Tax=Sphingomicrobium sediminis TaxID=2950949 RepID=A0A9X2EHX5_9SPHN|nr:DUF4142 domain-containing protein [Sphingomicrobium sediminis]MCM8558363.1 DUF4142 domain-containing protein [Sphingomicrobium sediminis]